jgi:hypothetical protein
MRGFGSGDVVGLCVHEGVRVNGWALRPAAVAAGILGIDHPPILAVALCCADRSRPGRAPSAQAVIIFLPSIQRGQFDVFY